jgi:uncharacterized membrane protein YkoI
MRRTLAPFAVSTVAVVLVLAAARAADEKAEKMTLDKAPKAVRDAVLGRFPGAQVTSLTKENEAGKIVYDVELKHRDRKYEMDLQEDGTILEIEKGKSLQEVPAALAKTIEAKFPKATIKDIMEVNLVKKRVETPDHYEVTIETADKKPQEVLITLDGKSFKEEKK